MASLQDLPTELLQRIATFLPCSAALRLIRVNHSLRAACNDQLIFKAIALNTRQHAVNWKDTEKYLEQASFDDTVRIAYAVDQAFLNAEAEYPLWGLQTSPQHGEFYIDEWLPHMLVVRNPAALTLQPETLLHVICRLSRTYQYTQTPSTSQSLGIDFLLHRFSPFHGLNSASQFTQDKQRDPQEIATKLTNIGFCLTALTLESIQWSQTPTSTFSAIREYNKRPDDPAKGQGDIYYTVARLLTRTASTPYASFKPIDAAPLPFAFLTWLHTSKNLGSVSLPVPSRMPLSTQMRIPFPFRGSGREFSTAHLASMTKPDFLAGQWMGLYTDERGQNLHIDPPMSDIRIHARQRGPNDRPARSITAMIDRSSTGQDARGEFRLSGEVHEDGHVDIAKLYFNTGWEWMWNGVVTPWGIMGEWGSMVGEEFGGYFWIWKEEWCGERGAVRWGRSHEETESNCMLALY